MSKEYIKQSEKHNTTHMDYLKNYLINNQKIYNLTFEKMIILLQNITLIDKNLPKLSLKSNFRSRNDLTCCLYEILEFPNKKC